MFMISPAGLPQRVSWLFKPCLLVAAEWLVKSLWAWLERVGVVDCLPGAPCFSYTGQGRGLGGRGVREGRGVAVPQYSPLLPPQPLGCVSRLLKLAVEWGQQCSGVGWKSTRSGHL